MPRLIDADVLIEKCNEDIEAVKDISQRVDGILDAVMNIHECPTIDAVPVVRCKDCKYKNVYRFPPKYGERDYCVKHEKIVDVADFCSWAERRAE